LQAKTSAKKGAGGEASASFFSHLLHAVRGERRRREEAARAAREEQLRRRREVRERQRVRWAEHLMNAGVKRQMRLMWEIPQVIGIFDILPCRCFRVAVISVCMLGCLLQRHLVALFKTFLRQPKRLFVGSVLV